MSSGPAICCCAAQQGLSSASCRHPRLLTLTQLLEDGPEDTTLAVLCRLPVRTLAALSATCRGLREAVARMPDALWQAGSASKAAFCPLTARFSLSCLLQAHARSEHPACHPIWGAADVRAYLRRRHQVSVNLERGRGFAAQYVPRYLGVLSPDGAKTARLARGSKVEICDASTGELLQQWALPHVPGPYCRPLTWKWATSCRHLMVHFGKNWGYQIEDESYDNRDDSNLGQGLGAVFVDCDSGQSAVIIYSELTERDGLVVEFRPSKCLIALCPPDSPSNSPSDSSLGSPINSLLDSTPDGSSDGAGHRVISVLDSQGTLVASTPSPTPVPADFAWCPAGETLLVRCADTYNAWLWHITGADPPLFLAMPSRPSYSRIAWEIPCRGHLLLGTYSDTAGHSVAYTDASAQCFLSPLPLAGAVRPLWCAVWGTRLALLARSSMHRSSDLHLYACVGGQLALQQVVHLEYRVCRLSISPDGELAAGLVSVPQGGAFSTRVAIFHLRTGVVRHLALPKDAQREPCGAAIDCWTADGCAIMLSWRMLEWCGPSWVCRLDMELHS